jgi:hypothetical protein
MDEGLSVGVITLEKLFSGEYSFRLPWFQRAYAWQVAHVWRLVDSMMTAMRQPGSKRRLRLGTLTLARVDGSTDTAIIDGHQRIMTLTILFAVLRDLEKDAVWHARLAALIEAPSSPTTSIPPVFRFVANPALAPFVTALVQEEGATQRAFEEDTLSLSVTERNIIDNRDSLRERLGRLADVDRRQLCAFLVSDCRVVVHVVDDENEAWEMLRIEEDTRMDFSDADQARWSLLAVVPPAERRHASRVWDECDLLLQPADLHAMLGHLCTIKTRHRLRRALEVEVCRTFDLNRSGLHFFGARMLPAAHRLAALRSRAVGGSASVDAVVERLHWIDRQVWVPPALHWLEVRGESDANAALFFRRLERLTWLLKIAGLDPSHQQLRMIRVLDDIDKQASVDAMPSLRVDSDLERDVLANLRTQNFCGKHYANPVLRRIETSLNTDPGPVDRRQVSVEHILPRNPPRRSHWTRLYRGTRDIAANVNRLGNMTFLSSTDNQLADTADWQTKRPILAASPFAVTRLAAAAEEWDSARIKERTEQLITLLFAALAVGE